MARSARLPRKARRGDSFQGTVIRLSSRHAIVEDEAGLSRRCTLRKSLFHGLSHFNSPIAVGDRVRITAFDESDAVVEEVLPRRAYLSRRLGESGKEQIIVANVDQVVVCAAVLFPMLELRLVDRILLAAERGGFEALIALTKIDLIDPEDRPDYEEIAERYEELGYKTLLISNETGEGTAELKEHLVGRITVFSGPSGAGKSTTLNRIEPGLSLRVQPVSDRWNKGKHTTTAVSLLPLKDGGWVADTPGVRSFGVTGFAPSDVAVFMPDLARFVEDCHLSDCTHIHEPDCAVQAAAAAGQIHPERYESYLRIVQGIEENEEEDAY